MFQFKPQNFVVRRLNLKAISQSTIDPRVTFVDEGGQMVKLPVPTAIARRIKQRLKVTRFNTSYPCEIAFYENRIVAMDAPTIDEYQIWKQSGTWETRLSKNARALNNLPLADWQYDGQYVYRTTSNILPIAGSNFGHQSVECYNLYQFGEMAGDDTKGFACLCYLNPQTNKWVVTSPVTRSSGDLLMLTGDTDAFDASSEFGATSDLLLMDRSRFPNLRFVNYAARAICGQFGYAAIEPLGLPLLMIEHRTFNLGSMSLPAQTSAQAPFKFTQALAWLIGLFGQATTLDQLLAVKQSTKMLLTKGNTAHATGTKSDEEVDTKKLIHQMRDKFDNVPLISFSNVKNVENFEAEE